MCDMLWVQVRVPVANSEIEGVTVSQNPDNKAKYRINICTHDRNNLLWEVTNRSLNAMPYPAVPR